MVYDLICLGATPAGITAAVAAARAGARVLLLEATGHVGGLNTSGLHTAEHENMDAGDAALAGLGLEFYRRLGRAYGLEFPLLYWESHVAEQVFGDLLTGAGVECRLHQTLHRVQMDGNRLRAVVMADDVAVAARLFIDATYEGDLLAAAGISYTVGREARTTYREALAGIRFVESADEVETYHDRRSRDDIIAVDPYGADGRLLPGIEPGHGIEIGAGDRKVMNYNFRVTVSTAPDRISIRPPPAYDPARFELLVPVCLSTSHVAFCAVRLESLWMALGHVAGAAAALALARDDVVQAVPVDILQNRLRAEGFQLPGVT